MPGARWLGLLVILTLLGLGGCGSPQQSYCGAVKDNQSKLANVTRDGSHTALLQALPIFTTLQSKAPQDIQGDWRTVTAAIQGLQDALDAAGVDAETYDRDHPPAGVSSAQRVAIDTAAAGLTQPATVLAFTAVQQEALDVCRTPLTL